MSETAAIFAPGHVEPQAASPLALSDERPHDPRIVTAMDALARWWPVIPLYDIVDGACSCGDVGCTRPAGKHPRIAWTVYQKHQTRLDELDDWRHRWPCGFNVGIVTGSISGIVVIDVDPYNGGDETMADLESRLGPLPRTRTIRTGSGGLHLYFQYPGSKLRARLVRGVDLKSDGGYVVAPDSLHASGQRYVLIDADAPIADLPPEWLAAARAADALSIARESARTRSAPSSSSRRGRVDRSSVTFSIALSCVNLGEPFERFRDKVLASPAGDKIRGRTPENQRRYLEATWRSAQRLAERYPRSIQRIHDAIRATNWTGRSGLNDRAIITANLGRAAVEGRLTYRVDVRTLAVTADVSRQTVSNAHKAPHRLRSWLVVVSRGSETTGTVYTLRVPPGRGRNLDSLSPPPPTDEDKTVHVSPCEWSHDVWRNGKGLGKAGRAVWVNLHEHSITVKAIADRLGWKDPRRVRYHLHHLLKHGLAAKTAHGWHRGTADLDDVARDLGVAGAGARQADQHRREREQRDRAIEANRHWANNVGRRRHAANGSAS